MMRTFGLILALLCGIASAQAASNPALITVVPTVAAMRAIGGAAAQYPNIQAAGYYAAGDGGGGIFSWSATSTASPDSCVTFQAVGVATGRYIRQLNNNSISLPQCGAKGDGTTNDTAAVQAAFTSVGTGGIIEVPAASGCYKVLSTISITKALTVRGAGCLTWATGGIAGLSASASNVTIAGVTLNGSQHASQVIAEAAINIYGTFRAGLAPINLSNINISNVTISNWGGFGISLGYVSDFTLSGNRVSDIGYAGIGTVSTVRGVVSGNSIKNIGVGFTPGVTNAYGMYLSRATADSANLTSQPRSDSISVLGNVVDNVPTWECYDTHGGSAITFDSNVGTNCYYGISVGPSNNSAGVSTYSSKNVALNGFSLSSISSAGASGAWPDTIWSRRRPIRPSMSIWSSCLPTGNASFSAISAETQGALFGR